jgi:hypothetical protein
MSKRDEHAGRDSDWDPRMTDHFDSRIMVPDMSLSLAVGRAAARATSRTIGHHAHTPNQPHRPRG